MTEWLQSALVEEPEEHDFDPRNQALDQVAEATKRDPAWGLDLVAEIASKEKWSSHLIRAVFDGWCSADLDEATLVQVFEAFSAEQLYPFHYNNMAFALETLLRRNRENVDEHSLTLANAVARRLWNSVPDTDPFQDSDWMTKATNHPAGQLAMFWLLSAESWISTQDQPSRPLSQEYTDGLSEMVREQGLRGNIARFMLASDFRYLAYVDLEWTRDNIIPLLTPSNGEFGSIWEGITYCGPLTPEAAELLKEPFLEAIDVIVNERVGHLKERFIRKYTQMLTYFATGPTDEWITKLIVQDDPEVNRVFGMEMGRILAFVEEDVQRELWGGWIEGYWKNRLLGNPRGLDSNEISLMQGWVTNLTGVFPQAVELVTQMESIPSNRVPILSSLGNDDLVERYPNDLAKLLIHVGKADTDIWSWLGLKNTVERLGQLDLPTELKDGLAETAARHSM